MLRFDAGLGELCSRITMVQSYMLTHTENTVITSIWISNFAASVWTTRFLHVPNKSWSCPPVLKPVKISTFVARPCFRYTRSGWEWQANCITLILSLGVTGYLRNIEKGGSPDRTIREIETPLSVWGSPTCRRNADLEWNAFIRSLDLRHSESPTALPSSSPQNSSTS